MSLTREQARERYWEKRKKSDVYKRKCVVKDLGSRYKGFKFSYDGTILSFEIKLPFRVMTEAYGAKHCDEKTYEKLQTELRRRIYKIDPRKNIIVIECQYIQVYLYYMDKVEDICQECRSFVKEKLEIYGSYIKSGRKVGEHFE